MAKLTRSPVAARLEAFSDAVLAIVLTLLVLELLPNGPQSPAQLLDRWPTYLAFLAAFMTIGITWLNHSQQTARIRSVTPAALVLNLGVLLGASLVPWPTTLISVALQSGDRASQIAAIFVFALVSIVLSIPWLGLDLYLARHPELLRSPCDAAWMRDHARASIGTIIGAVVSIGVAFVSPIASLVIYLVVAIAFIVLRLRENTPVESMSSEQA